MIIQDNTSIKMCYNFEKQQMKFLKYFLMLVFISFQIIFCLIFFDYSNIFVGNLENEKDNYKKNYTKNDTHNFESEDFNIKKDLIAFLHFPKTHGSEFETKLIMNLKIYDEESKKFKPACLKRPKTPDEQRFGIYYCPRDFNNELSSEFSMRSSWILSRYIFGWNLMSNWKCGLHGVHDDMSELNLCVQNIKKENKFLRKIHFITILREENH